MSKMSFIKIAALEIFLKKDIIGLLPKIYVAEVIKTKKYILFLNFRPAQNAGRRQKLLFFLFSKMNSDKFTNGS